MIDALDECQKLLVFLSLVAKVTPYLRIFLTSRSTPEVEQGLTTLGPLAEHYQMQREDTDGDLRIFVSSRMDRLPAGDDKGRIKLKERILRKASGSFLWVSLIVQELEQAYSEEGAEEVLNEVPVEMNQLYARMLESVPENGRAMRLAKSVFMWTLLSARALALNEMQCAIKLDTDETVHNLGNSISAICGQLVCVDHSNRVQSIHQTAKTFLLHQKAYPAHSHCRDVSQSLSRQLLQRTAATEDDICFFNADSGSRVDGLCLHILLRPSSKILVGRLDNVESVGNW